MSTALQPPPQLASVKSDGSRVAIHPADVRGRFLNRRRGLFAALLAVYVALPLVKMGGYPAIYLELEERHFHFFGVAFNAQDTWLLVLLLLSLALGLLFVTAWLGRVWCGWACPQTVFLEGLYRPIERFFDGPRERRLKAAGQPWTAGRALRAVGKQSSFAVLSLMLAVVAISFFISFQGIGALVTTGPVAHPIAFVWLLAVAAGFYVNFAWFREQLCIVVCPYGRLQSAMQDRDSLIVGYDARRGEPRGRFIKTPPPDAPKVGDCVDCNRCVQVCPTGIDIRQGLQMECLACAQCLDACDEVMDKLGRPRGLVRYDSQNGLAGDPKRVLRPRVYLYGAIFGTAALAFVLAVALRTPFEAVLLRARGVPWMMDGTALRNQFDLNLVNKNAEPTRLHLEVKSPVPVSVEFGENDVGLAPFQKAEVPLFASLESADFRGSFELTVIVSDEVSGERKELPVKFLGPLRPLVAKPSP